MQIFPRQLQGPVQRDTQAEAQAATLSLLALPQRLLASYRNIAKALTKIIACPQPQLLCCRAASSAQMLQIATPAIATAQNEPPVIPVGGYRDPTRHRCDRCQ